MRFNRLRGEITVLCALLFGVISSLITVVLFSARAQLVRVRAEELMQIGLRSCAGEFNQDLLELYDIFGIDVSYRDDSGSIDNVLSHFCDYVSVNINQNALLSGTADLWKVAAENEELTGYRLLSDGDGSVFMEAVSQYIATKSISIKISDIQAMGSRLSGVNDSEFMSGFAESLAEGGAVSDNPAIEVYEMATSEDVLSMAAINRSPYGTMNSSCPGKRSLNQGTAGSNARFTNAAEDISKYISDKFGYYISPKSYSVMDCEREYLASGEMNSSNALRTCAKTILAQREPIQLEEMFGDEGTLTETRALAETLCDDGYGNVDMVQKSLLYALAYAESVMDISALLNGGRVLADSTTGRRISLDNLRNFISFCPASGGDGASYEEYLNGMIWNTPFRDKLFRCMDIIELNLKANHHPGFSVDGTITQMSISMDITSAYGTDCSVEREYDYYHK